MSLFNANYCPQGVTYTTSKVQAPQLGSPLTAAFIPTLSAISNSQLCSRNPVSAHLRLSLIYIVVDTVDRSSYPLSISLYSQKAFPISVPSFIPHRNHLSLINPNQQVWESLCTGIMKHSLGGDAQSAPQLKILGSCHLTKFCCIYQQLWGLLHEAGNMIYLE